MAEITTTKREVEFTLKLTEKEMGTLLAGIHHAHNSTVRNAEYLKVPHLDLVGECELHDELVDAIKGAK